MKKIKNLLILTIAVGILSAGSIEAFGVLRQAKVTLLVVDDNGMPVTDAKVGVGFQDSGGNYKGENGTTGGDGLFSASHECLYNIQYGAEKDGYYPSHYHYTFTSRGSFRLEPWNPTLNVLLRKIENPVPMYVRNSMNSRKKIKIPVVGKDVGFDLSMYDFVEPYGAGVYSDMIFRLEKSFIDMENYDAKLTIKFLKSTDGIQKIKESKTDGNSFKLPRFAPENGYNRKIEIFKIKKPGEKLSESSEYDDNYLFRIRSELHGEKIIKAMYGKIRGPIEIEPRREPTEVYLTYYLNPDYTRNLEFDPKRNLFGNLPEREQVNEP